MKNLDNTERSRRYKEIIGNTIKWCDSLECFLIILAREKRKKF